MKRIALSLFFIAAFFYSEAQIEKDAGCWITLSVQKPFTKRLTAVVDQEFRLKENYQRINLFYTNLGIDYKFSNNIKLSPTYRSIQKQRLDGSFSYRHRLMLDATIKKKFEKITLSERIRYQAEVGDYLSSEKGKLVEQFLRLKTDLKFTSLKKISPYISCEVRYQIRDPKGKGPFSDNGFHRIRYVAGAEYQLKKNHNINLYYLIQTEYYIADPESIYILGIAYTLTLQKNP